jgi:hypothetical protein
LALKEIIEVEDFENILSTLKKFRKILKKRQERIKELVIEDQKL